MNHKITIKSIFKLALHDKSIFVKGQIFTLLAIIVSVPIPLMLPMMVDEVLLHKPHYIVPAIDKILGSGSAFYYIALVAFSRYIFTCFILFTRCTQYKTFYTKYQNMLRL